jgi:hypothetical protein
MKSLLEPTIKLKLLENCVKVLFPKEIKVSDYLYARTVNYFRHGLNLSNSLADIVYVIPEYLHPLVFNNYKIPQLEAAPHILGYVQDNLIILEDVKQYYLLHLLVK